MTPLLERHLAANLEHRLRELGLDWYHTYRSTRSPEGFPDYVIRTPGHPLHVELKKAGGSPTPAQASWLLYLAGCGLPAILAAGVAGVDAVVELAAGMAKGRRLMPTALGRVLVFGDVSPAGRAAVSAADDRQDGGSPAAGRATPPRRHRRGTR